MEDNRTPPLVWGEAKQRINIMLTPALIELIDQAAKEVSIARSEMIERLIRGLSGDPHSSGGLTSQEMVQRLVDEVRWADRLPRRKGNNQPNGKAAIALDAADEEE